MDNIIINDMTKKDFNFISDRLILDFDKFWSVQNLKSEFENSNSKCIVAKIDLNIVGFACIWKSVDEYHITNIVTKEEFRKRGIAAKLLQELISICINDNNITSITLEVNEKNIPAQKLYEKFGFKVVGIRKKYYNNIDNAVIMTMEVNK